MHESTALISHAINIRELVLEQSIKYNEGRRSKPYVSHGSISYHYNNFIKAFEILDRVEIVIPWTPSFSHGLVSPDSGIATANSYLKAQAKLSSVIGLYQDPMGDLYGRAI